MPTETTLTTDCVDFQNTGHGKRIRNPLNPKHVLEDVKHLVAKHPAHDKHMLDVKSFINGYRKQEHPVEYLILDQNGKLKQRIHSKNLRTNVGGRWEANILTGGIAAAFGSANTSGGGFPLPSGVTYVTTPPTSTTLLTNETTYTGVATGQYNNYVLVATWGSSGGNAAFGVVTNVTNSSGRLTFTVDKWHSFYGYSGGATTDSTATTPTATNGTYALVPAAPGLYMALSSYSSFAANSGSTTGSTQWNSSNELTNTVSLGRAISTTNWTNAGSWNNSTFGDPGLATTGSSTNTGAFQFVYTWTASGAGATIYGSGVMDSSVAQSGALIFEAALTTTATLASGDTLKVSWTVNY